MRCLKVSGTAILVLLFFTTCDNLSQPVLSSFGGTGVQAVAVSRMPERTAFAVDEDAPDWTAAGLEVTATLGNGGRHTLAPDEYTVSGWNSALPGELVLTVQARGSKGAVTTVFSVFITGSPAPEGVAVFQAGAEAAANGAIRVSVRGNAPVSTLKAAEGESILVVVTPAAGYALSSGSLRYVEDTQDNGFSSGTTITTIDGNTFTMPAHAVRVSAAFTAGGPQPLSGSAAVTTVGDFSGVTVTARVTAWQDGRMLGAAAINAAGTAQGFTIPVPSLSGNIQYKLDVSVTYGGVTTAFPTVQAADVPVGTPPSGLELTIYRVAVQGVSNGTVSASAAAALAGDTITVTVTPAAGFVLAPDSLKYNDGTDNAIAVASNAGSFTMPSAAVTISCAFARAEASVNGVPYGSLAAALAAVPAGGSAASPAVITITASKFLSSQTVIPANKHVLLTVPEGQNRTLTRSSGMATNTSADQPLFSVEAGASLALRGNGSGTLTLDGGGTMSNQPGAPLIINNNGTVAIHAGAVLRNNKSNLALGGAIRNASGILTMDGGTISGCSGPYGGGVYLASGSFTMSGGTISGNTALNYASAAQHGTIVRGTGGGVYVATGSFTMSGGTIYGDNTADANSADSQYAALAWDAGVTINWGGGGAIGGNSASGGVGKTIHGGSPGSFVPQDIPTYAISAGTGFTVSPTAAAAGSTVTVTATASGGNTFVGYSGVALTAGGTAVSFTQSTADPAQAAFVMPDGGVTVSGQAPDLTSGGAPAAAIIRSTGTVTFTDISAAFAGARSGETVYALKSCDLSAAANFSGKTLTLKPFGTAAAQSVTLKRILGFAGNLFGGSGNLTLAGNGSAVLTIDGNKAAVTPASPMISIEAGGAVTLNTGTALRNNSCGTDGAGVYVSGSGASFTMADGTISGCSASGNGGGVYVDNGAAFTKTGGTVYGTNGGANANTAFAGASLFVTGGGTAAVNGTSQGTTNDTI